MLPTLVVVLEDLLLKRRGTSRLLGMLLAEVLTLLKVTSTLPLLWL